VGINAKKVKSTYSGNIFTDHLYEYGGEKDP
jgi:hypothetical protein